MFREAYPIFLFQRGGLLGLGSFGPAGTESRGWEGKEFARSLRHLFNPRWPPLPDKFPVRIVGLSSSSISSK
jgi:hypothetical protein